MPDLGGQQVRVARTESRLARSRSINDRTVEFEEKEEEKDNKVEGRQGRMICTHMHTCASPRQPCEIARGWVHRASYRKGKPRRVSVSSHKKVLRNHDTATFLATKDL